MNHAVQKIHAITFNKLHKESQLFTLPNAWDVGSAWIFEKAGFSAIATTSAGIAYAKAQPDGEIITLNDLIQVTTQITNRINIPLSVDLERGYADNTQQVCRNVEQIIQAGAVGINLEDGYPGPNPKLEDLETQLDKIQAIAKLKTKLDIPFVINARTCAYWLKIGHENERLQLVIDRCNTFAEAGADCVFIPGIMDYQTIQTLSKNINAPINIIANPLSNDLNKLNDLGVTRLSIGSGAVRSVFAHLINIADKLKNQNTIEPLFDNQFSYDKANEFFT
ncbi:isocitrate lyase/phosphoenolpyruvate mutase family protein [Planctomycetota bacterium]|nr:isocitrate lyase/phosphoenolpyruvate mutase family protein [Planctomycetota bacterium]